MLKKIFLASVISGLTLSTAYANTAPYVGANIGITTNTSSFVANSITTVGTTTTIGGTPANYRGVPFNLFAGYGGIISQCFYLAGEVFGTIGNAEISNNNNLKTSYAYGASVLPGMMLSDNTLAFIRAGVVRTRFSNVGGSTQTGGQVGLGLQTTLTQNVDVRAEYDFTAYRSFNNHFGRVSSPRTDAYNLGLVYNFD